MDNKTSDSIRLTDATNPRNDVFSETETNLDNESEFAEQTTPSISSEPKKSRLKPAARIAIGVVAVVATFVVGIIVGAVIQYNLAENVVDHPNYYRDIHPVAEKPMIYLYPEEETEISVQLGKPELLTTTYPKYNSGWTVLAKPDGTLYDKSGREFYGLYWEGSAKYTEVKDDGFVVPGKDSTEFLEEKLTILGLTEREANEFIIYWLPKLESSPYNYIRFETNDEIENYMPLTVSPKPDSIIRIIMDYKPLSKPISISEQQLETPTRTGFTVVEWGGTQIGENKIH